MLISFLQIVSICEAVVTPTALKMQNFYCLLLKFFFSSDQNILYLKTFSSAELLKAICRFQCQLQYDFELRNHKLLTEKVKYRIFTNAASYWQCSCSKGYLFVFE